MGDLSAAHRSDGATGAIWGRRPPALGATLRAAAPVDFGFELC